MCSINSNSFVINIVNETHNRLCHCTNILVFHVPDKLDECNNNTEIKIDLLKNMELNLSGTKCKSLG